MSSHRGLSENLFSVENFVRFLCVSLRLCGSARKKRLRTTTKTPGLALERLRIDAKFAHLCLESGALHAEFGGGTVVAPDFAGGVAERADDGIALGGFERHDGGAADAALEFADRE